jgi:hypothetical protein
VSLNADQLLELQSLRNRIQGLKRLQEALDGVTTQHAFETRGELDALRSELEQRCRTIESLGGISE